MSVAVAELYSCELLCRAFIFLSEIIDIFLFPHISHYFAAVIQTFSVLVRVFIQAAVSIGCKYLIIVAILLLISHYAFSST